MATKPAAPGSGYRINLNVPNDRDHISAGDRDRSARLLSVIVTLFVLLIVPIAFTTTWASMLGIGKYGVFGGFFIGGMLCIMLFSSRMVVYNPEWTAFVTQDVFTGKMVPYGPGLHLSHWWEQHSRTLNYSLKVITHPFEIKVPTKTALVTITGKFEYAYSLSNIIRAVGVDTTTIQNGMTGFIESFLLGRVRDMTAEEVRMGVKTLNEALSDTFMPFKKGGETPEFFADSFGFTTVSIFIEDTSFSEEVQRTRNAVDEAKILQQIMASLLGVTPKELANMVKKDAISKQEYKDLMNRAMAVSDNAKLDITVIEGSLPAAVADVIAKRTKKRST